MGLAAAASSTIGSTAMIAGGLVSGGIGGAVAAAGVSAVINSLALPVFVFLMAMLTPGIIISYVLPLIPYTLWIAGVTGWIILVCEAMIAVPLWMLAHMTMGGDGLHGRAVEGWGLLFNVMFRPVLMVLGLFLSFFVFQCDFMAYSTELWDRGKLRARRRQRCDELSRPGCDAQHIRHD